MPPPRQRIDGTITGYPPADSYTPTDQAWIESLNGHIKIDYPHLLAIRDPAILRAELAVTRAHYNEVRLHQPRRLSARALRDAATGFTPHEYIVLPVHHSPPAPGLVLGWERRDGRWRAEVVMVLEDRRSNAGPFVLQRWMRVEDLRPVPSEPRSPDPRRWHLGWVDDPKGREWSWLRTRFDTTSGGDVDA